MLIENTSFTLVQMFGIQYNPTCASPTMCRFKFTETKGSPPFLGVSQDEMLRGNNKFFQQWGFIHFDKS